MKGVWNGYHHHHHHRFTSIFHTKARVRRYQQLTYSIKVYSAHLRFLTHTLSCLFSHTLHPCLSTPPFPYTTYHLQISALRNPIISLLTFHMSKSSQPNYSRV